MFPLLSIWSDWGILILRVVFGMVCVVHGWPKIRNWAETARNFEAMGFRPGKLLGPLVAIVEFFGGVGLIIGFGTQLIAAALLIQFAVIVLWKLKNREKFAGGWEFDIVLLAIAALFIVLGGGAFALDHTLTFGGL
ncbi:MAG: DoxX family protein [Candidatus Liptonbacteria bacterium]|nr:DoxX family protein [Candidatus Liptonbacteria bacterium]